MDRAESNVPQQSNAPQEAAPPVPDVSDTTQAHAVGPDQSPVFVPLLEGTPGSPLPDPLPQSFKSYDRLLSSYFGLRRSVVEPQRDLDDSARLASPFVQFVQQKFSIQANKLQLSQQECAELRNALQERLDNACELADLRDHLAYRERVHADAVASFEQTIDDLNRRLAVVLAAATANALGASVTDPQLQARLDAAIANQADTARDLDDAQESIKALEASQTALENSNRNVRQQITNLRSRVAQTEADAAAVLTRVLDERDRFQALLDKSDQEVQDHLTALRQARDDRGRALADIVQARKYHSITTVSPLILHRDFRRSVPLHPNSPPMSRSPSGGARHQPGPQSQPRSPPNRTPTKHGSSSKKRRQRYSSSRPPSPRSCPSRKRRPLRRQSTGSADSSDDDDVNHLHAGLAQSHSSTRRSLSSGRSSQGSSGMGTQATPIHVDTSDSGGSSLNSASRGGLGQRRAQADHDGTSGGGRSTADASAGGRSSGNDGDDGSAGFGRSDSFLSDRDRRQLTPTKIPRERWIPGYHGSVNFSVADVDPWPVHHVRQLSVRYLTVSKLFHDWCRPPFWLFPQRVPVPSPGTWYPELITETNIVALYTIRPWTVLQRVISPRSSGLIHRVRAALRRL
ncbi:unnamed protein product [Phytophthora fragariaefolia]|uniref:Unnamed protein product n=1 Tax=Phytophthora fragariaefolia TaxID=1490495 RepID=A0A9W6X3L2_9STRA|nr:unnamed protein product [Phytophthora fragariaefolia]